MNLTFNKKRRVKRTVCGQEISVVPYITLEEKSFIISEIVEGISKRMSGNEEFPYIVAGVDVDLDMLLIKLTTEVENGFDEYEEMIASGFITMLHETIVNYDDIRATIESIIYIKYIETILPDKNSLVNDLTALGSFMENMDEEQKGRFDTIARAAVAHASTDKFMGIYSEKEKKDEESE